MRAAIYTRISSDPTGQQMGVTRQLEDCEALAERLGWEVVGRFEDNDISAYNGKKRPGFEAMLAAMKHGEFDMLVCWHPDRLYRSLKDLERLIDIAEARGVNIRSVNGGDLDLSNSTGKMLARIVGSVSRAESEHKAERQRRANMQRAQAGGWWSSHRVFGYTQTGAEFVEREAKMIRQAAADVLAGQTLTAVARQWNESGVTSARGAKWNVARIKRLLVNPRYAGVRTYKGKIVGPGDWPAILDSDTHAGLVAVLRDPSRGTAVSWERKYLGSYRYVCGICRAPMKHAISTHSDGSCYHRYTCTASPHLSRAQPDLDAYVEAVVLGHLRDDAELHLMLADARGRKVDVTELHSRRAALQARADELAGLFAEGAIDASQLRRGTGELRSKISEIDGTLADLARRNPAADLLAGGLDELETRWAALSPDMKGKVIDEVCTVVVNPSPKGRYFRPEYIDFEPKL